MIRRQFLLAAPAFTVTGATGMLTDQNEAVLTKALTQIGELSSGLIRDECKSPEDALAVAIALCTKAQDIFIAIGGKRDAAAQFYAFADRNTQ